MVGCDPAIRTEWSSDACAKEGLGSIDDVRPGPVIDGKRTIEVRYTTGVGTGISEHSVSLLQKSGRSYRTLWTHGFLDISNNLGVRNFRIRYRWNYDPKRSRMIVTGTKSRGGAYDLATGAGAGKSIQRLGSEVFCYSSRLGKFVRC